MISVFHKTERLACAAMLLILGGSVLRAANDVAPASPSLQVADQFFPAIPKDGFGKDYLFSASLIPQGQSPTNAPPAQVK